MAQIWRDILAALPQPRLVTLVGGGGKTSLLYHLQMVCRQEAWPAVATSTTKMAAAPSPWRAYRPVGSEEELCAAAAQAEENALIAEGQAALHGKVDGLPQEWIANAARRMPDTYFLVEGDGSAGRSLKGHLAHEPVIPGNSSLVIFVLGLDAIGQILDERSVHRPQRVAELAALSLGAILDEERICALLLQPEGWLKNCPDGCALVIYLNKSDLPGAQAKAARLAALLKKTWGARLQQVVSGSLREGTFCLE
ncbi:selenium cofactor biosynthesis protein YqeC [Azotosporobacter soli]|uniref:selenium cofactor biosynthesis protein YqeC n=1 Tax=Azotosporobacter soli TaxID=3055040 RepID=UPI0031FEDD7F